MILNEAIEKTSQILFISLFIQGIEMLILTRGSAFQKIWSYHNLKNDFEIGLPLPNEILSLMFSQSALTALYLFQIVIAGLGFFYPHISFVWLLFFSHLTNCIRFRGTFNGGSDMMMFVVLTGTLIALSGSEEKIQKLGLIYIAIHTIYSYFKAGFSKIIRPEWRSGEAISIFIKRSLISGSHQLAFFLERNRILSFIFCWFILLFELSSLSLIFFPSSANVTFYFAIAIFFHISVYLIFGLNRFTWVWFSAWPATLYSLSLLTTK